MLDWLIALWLLYVIRVFFLRFTFDSYPKYIACGDLSSTRRLHSFRGRES